MKFTKTLLGSLVVLTTLAIVSVSSAAPSTNAPSNNGDLGSWTLSLSGVGSSALNGSTLANSAIGGEFQIGHSGQFVLPLEAGVRQSIAYSDASGANWLFATKAYSDWTIVRLGNLEFDAGGNIGLNYGNQTLKWEAAPEAVARLYLKEDVDVFARVEYPFDLNQGKAENSLTYTAGLRIRF